MGDEAEEVFFYDIYADVDRAAVYFDSEYVGDLSGGVLTVRVVSEKEKPYDHVTLKLDGYEDTTADLPKPGDTLQHVSVFLTMTPLVSDEGSPTGAISISSSPSGAEIVMNGEARGTTPQTFSDISPGTYTIRVAKQGYRTWTETTVIRADETTKVYANLEKKRTFGRVSLDSDPKGADIYLDGWYYGTTPMTVGGITTGPHAVELKKDGFNDFTTSVTVDENAITPVTCSLVPINCPTETGCTLSVSSSPPGAMVFIDSVKKGVTPITVDGLTPDKHEIKLTYAGYNDYQGSVSLSNDETRTVDIAMEPLPASEYAPVSFFPLLFSLIAAFCACHQHIPEKKQ